MNLLIQRLGEYYERRGLKAVLEEERNRLSLKQRILTSDGFLNLVICVTGSSEDCQKYTFSCYGLGCLRNATEKDLFRIELFNEDREEIKMYLEEDGRVLLAYDKIFYEITPYDLGLDTMGEAMKCISVFAPFIQGNYSILKQILRPLK